MSVSWPFVGDVKESRAFCYRKIFSPAGSAATDGISLRLCVVREVCIVRLLAKMVRPIVCLTTVLNYENSI
jgi:hypothetical protein